MFVDVYSILCLCYLITCVCVCHVLHGPLRDCLRAGLPSGFPSTASPFVCMPAVQGRDNVSGILDMGGQENNSTNPGDLYMVGQALPREKAFVQILGQV